MVRFREKHEPVSDIDTVVMDSLKVLDPTGRLEKRTCRNAHSNAAKVSDQQSTSGYSRDCSHRADRLSFERS